MAGEDDGRLRRRGEGVGQVGAELGVGGVAVGGAEDDQAVGFGVVVLAGVEVADGGGREALGEVDADVEQGVEVGEARVAGVQRVAGPSSRPVRGGERGADDVHA